VLKHKRLVSIIATIAFCLSFLAPALLAPAPAVAASSYTTLTAPAITVPAAGVALGKVAIDIPEVAALTAGDTFTITLPVGVTMPAGLAGAGLNGSGANVIVDETVALDPTNFAGGELGAGSLRVAATTDRNIDVEFLGSAKAFGAARIIVYFDVIDVSGVSGDINATFAAAPNTGWTSGSAVIAKLKRRAQSQRRGGDAL
jgi:hypothetical protein